MILISPSPRSTTECVCRKLVQSLTLESIGAAIPFYKTLILAQDVAEMRILGRKKSVLLTLIVGNGMYPTNFSVTSRTHSYGFLTLQENGVRAQGRK